RVPQEKQCIQVFIVSHGGRRVCRSAPRTAAPSGSVTSYPTVDQVIVVHARLIAKFGGSLRLRDRGGLRSCFGEAGNRLLIGPDSGGGRGRLLVSYGSVREWPNAVSRT